MILQGMRLGLPAICVDSFNTYRFMGTFNETVLLSFDYDTSDSRYNGSYQVEF